MAEFNLKLTQGGAILLAKAKLGKQLNFKYITLGSGVYEGNPQEATAFVNKVIDLNIQEKTRKDTVAFLKATLTYNAVPDGFVWTELGVIAIDPDTQEEVLYMYDAIDMGEVIPPATSATQIEKVIQVASYVSNAPNISVVIDESLINIPKSDIGQPNGVAPLNEDGVLDIQYGGTGAKTAQEALYKLGAMCNENLLDNAHFYAGSLVNTNGLKTWSTSYTPAFNRWFNGREGSVITLSEDNKYVFLNENGDLLQYIRHGLFGRTVCFSVLTSDGLYSGSMTMPNETPSENYLIKVFENEKITLICGALKQGGFQVSILSNNHSTNAIIAAKLEFGEHQTLARQTNKGIIILDRVNYFLEELKCNWYYEKNFHVVSAPIEQTLQFKTSKRIVPTIIFTSIAGATNKVSKWTGSEWEVVPFDDVIVLSTAYKDCVHIKINQDGVFAFNMIVDADIKPVIEGA